MASDSDTDTWH